jgi:hypothetical protein
VFATAATVTIAFTVGEAGSPGLYWSQLDADGFAALSTSIADGEATAPVTHFSSGFVGIPLPSTIDGGTCGSGETSCGGACVDTTSDPLNCGGCTNACPVVDGGASCLDSQCVGGGT